MNWAFLYHSRGIRCNVAIGGVSLRLTKDDRVCCLARACRRATMKIVDAKVIVCCPGRNFVTVKITTEDRVYGLGDATLNGRELAVASYLSDHILPLLIG